MKRLLRRWKLLLCLLVGLPLLLLAIAQWILSSQLTPEALVRRIESQMNCRAEIATASGNLWSFPAKLELTGLKLGPRDADADSAKPLKERSAFAIKETGLGVNHASLEVNVWALLTGSLDVRDILLEGVDFNSVKTAAGISTLQVMLEKPLTVAGKPNPEHKEKAPAPPKEAKPAGESAPSTPFNVKDLPLVSSARSVKVSGFRIDYRSEKRKEVIRWDQGNLSLEDLSADPAHLDKRNHARVALSGRLQVLGKRKVYHADLGLLAAGDFAPFDPVTGDLAEIPLRVTIEKDSALEDVPALQKMGDKMRRWEKYGLKFAALPDNARVLEQTQVDFALHGDLVHVRSPLTLQLDNYKVDLEKGGWINATDNQCKLEIRLTASEPISRQAMTDFGKSLTDKFGDSVGGRLTANALAAFKTEGLILADGRVSVPMGLTGDIGRPKVDDRVQPILQDVLKDVLLQMLIPASEE
jgi:hypothetical protein